MRKKSALLSGAAFGVLLAASLGASANAKAVKHHRARAASAHSVLAEKVETLSAAVSDLENRLNQESQARQALQAQAQAAQDDAAAARADAQAAHTELAEQIQTIPGAVQGQINTAIAANQPKTDKIYYKGVTVTLGGFLEAAAIYRTKTEGSDIASSFAKIPFGNAGLAHVGEFRGTARQSRLSFLAQGDINKTTHAAFYGEFDFLGAAQTANSNESNSYNPRIRNIYGTVDWDDYGLHLLAGQNWSLVTLNSKGISPRNEVTPPAIDAQYVPGFAWARQPQIRITKDFDNKQIWLAASLENPQTTFTGTAGNGLPTGVTVADLVTGNTTINGAPAVSTAASGFNSVNTFSMNRAPDVVGKIAFEPDINGERPVHLEAFGLWRDYYDEVTIAPGGSLGLAAGTRTTDSSSASFGGSVTASVVPKLVDLQGSVMSGTGIGRYGSAQLSDATLTPEGKVAPIPETMFLVGGTVHATKALDFYVFGGQERENAKDESAFKNGISGATALYGFGNLTNANFTAAGCDTVGGSCSATVRQVDQITGGIWDKAYTGSFGLVRIGVQYSHTWLAGFAGPNGYVPKTTDDMVFTSFRYYPF